MMNHIDFRRTGWIVVAACLMPLGCAGPGPKLFPVTPVNATALPDGGWRRDYDIDVDQRTDAFELLSSNGLVTAISSDADPAHTVVLNAVPPEEQRHLVLLLDSIPFEVADEVWREGRLRYCHRPSRIIAPFPVMTDLSFCEFFGCSPSPGIEASFYNGRKLTSGYDVYAQEGNVIWQRNIDWHMNPLAHVSTYLDPHPWFDHELRRIADLFLKSPDPLFVAYCVGTSAVGASGGRTGHQAALVRLDRFCQWLMFQTQGRARITLLSDHGHAFYDSKRIPLRDIMTEMGYRVRSGSLRQPNDVVIPEFGMVSAAAIHTHSPERVARDLIGVEGIELAAYPEHGEIVVLSRGGRGVISHRDNAFRYQMVEGDPLQLKPVLDQLTQAGQVGSDGFVSDRAWFDATVSAAYPDVLSRLWRAFHGLVEYPPDVLLSLADGYHAGSPTMTSLIDLIGVHGSLRQQSSSGMAMTMAGELPPVLRMADLKAALEQRGVPFKAAIATAPAAN